MAIYHLSVKPISRADGRPATAAAAYRSAKKSTTTDQVFDYTRKRGVKHSEIVLPSNEEISCRIVCREMAGSTESALENHL